MATTLTANIQSGQTLAQALTIASTGYPTDLPTRTGYTFASWNTSADGTGTTIAPETVLTANTTVYAIWTVAGGTLNIYVTSVGSVIYFNTDANVTSNLTIAVSYLLQGATTPTTVQGSMTTGSRTGSVNTGETLPIFLQSATVTPTSDTTYNYAVIV